MIKIDPDHEYCAPLNPTPEQKLIAACILEAIRSATKGNQQDIYWLTHPGNPDTPFTLAWCAKHTIPINRLRKLSMNCLKSGNVKGTVAFSRLLAEIPNNR
jgi:hypothetical protein